MGHLGFSTIGFLWLAMLLIPNFLWTKYPPDGYDPSNERPVLLLFERAGQVLVTCAALCFSDYNLKPIDAWSLWLAASFALMLLYECWWIRYFKSEKTLRDFYSSFLGVPVAGAVLPVLAFLLLGIYGKVLWMALSAAVLGVGHIGIHLQHFKNLPAK